MMSPTFKPFTVARAARSAGRYQVHHVADATGKAACSYYLILCGKTVALAAVPIVLRCQRPGCRTRWPEEPEPVEDPAAADEAAVYACRSGHEQSHSGRCVTCGLSTDITRWQPEPAEVQP